MDVVLADFELRQTKVNDVVKKEYLGSFDEILGLFVNTSAAPVQHLMQKPSNNVPNCITLPWSGRA